MYQKMYTNVDVSVPGLILTGSSVQTSGAEVNIILDEDSFASDNASALATQQSIKAYVDANVSVPNIDAATADEIASTASAALPGVNPNCAFKLCGTPWANKL